MTALICPLAPESAPAFISLSQTAQEEGADLVELRLDRCAAAGADVQALLAAIPQAALPVCVTCRHPSEGGAWPSERGEAARLELLLAADAAGAAYIDVELQAVERLPRRPQRAQLILSYHDFSGMGEDLPGRLQAMRSAGAAVAKIAVCPQDADDLAPLADLCRDYASNQQLMIIGMGEVGLPTRLLAGAWGCSHTFARLAADAQGSAPGQPCLQEMRDIYRLHAQNQDSLIFGVIGNPIAHSLSPRIHNAAFAHDAVNALYVPFLVHDAQRFWDACGDWIDGLSITIPHKHSLINAGAYNEPLADQIGAINTLYRSPEGQLIGANTDAPAALECIARVGGRPEHSRCLLLGAGGVARAIACALQQAGAALCITNRHPERAQALAEELGCRWCSLEEASQEDYSVLINATSVGMGCTQSPWPAEAHRPGSAVFDTVYTPLETRLLQDAAMAGCHCQDGLRMFIRQAAGQYERWLGQPAPEPIMQRTALEALTAS